MHFLRLLRRISLKTRVTLFTLAIFISVAVVFGFHMARLLRADMQRLITAQQFSTSETMASIIDGHIVEHFAAMEQVASVAEPRLAQGPAAVQQVLDNLPVFQGMFNGGVFVTDATGRATTFLEKPADPPGLPDDPARALASMGIYVFETARLADLLRRDAADAGSSRDFGKDIIPYLVQHGNAVAHRFTASCVRSAQEPEAYWRDVGTVDAYWEANIDLTETLPALDLYDRDWPIWTYSEVTPPAKFVHDLEGRRGSAVASLVSGGCIVSGASIKRTMLSPNVRVNSFSSLEEAVVLPSVLINRNVSLKKVVIDTSVVIPEGLVVGEDPELDAKRFRRTASGICLITQPMIDRLSL